MIFYTGFATSQIILCTVLNILTTTKGDIGVAFLKEPTSVMVNPKDGKTAFRCSASPPSASIEWLQNGQKISEDPEGMFRIQPQKLTVRLSKSPEESGPGRPASTSNRQTVYPGGLYLQCLARYKGQAIISHPAKLIVAKLSPFANKNDSYVTVIRGNTAVIPCKPPYSVPSAVTEFEYNRTLIDRTKDRYLLQPSGNLQILNAQINDSGIYHCIAHNPFLIEKEPSKHFVHLIVKDEKSLQAARLFGSLPETTTVVMGSNITLECSSHGNPFPNITWHKRNGKLPQNRFLQIAGNLLLFSVRRGDEGLYICKAENGIGKPITTETLLEVQEIAQIMRQKHSRNKRVNEGEQISLDCITRGQPTPEVMWYHNGVMVQEHSRNTIKENKLIIHQAKHHNGGIYQCFASNELGATYANIHLTVICNEKTLSNSSSPGGKHHHHHHEVKHKSTHKPNLAEGKPPKRRKHKGVKMVPPTKPDVHRLSDDSVMVSWNVPHNDGLPIHFFKVQYKEAGKQKNDIWSTIDDEIAAHLFTYAVTNLKKGGKYRFRIAAVYSNNDNKIGPKSAKFSLQKDSPMKKPNHSPDIIHVEAISPSAITLRWEYSDYESVPIEGFFIYYRATHSAGNYFKLTVLGSNTRSHIISHLLPETSYDVKMQSFNSAGTSDFSNIYTSKTKESEILEPDPKSTIDPIVPGPRVNVGSSTNRLLYIILGVALGVMIILLIVFLVLFNVKRNQRRQQRRGNTVNSEMTILPRIVVNGHTTEGNGYIPNSRAKVNISVNPLSEVENDLNGDRIYPIALQYQEVPSNNNEVILLSTIERNRRQHDNSDINVEDRQQNNGLLSGEHHSNQINAEIAESQT